MAYHQVVFDGEGNPRDYIFLEVNPAFEEMTGLFRDRIIGERVSEIFAREEYRSYEWQDLYRKLNPFSRRNSLEKYFKSLDSWYQVILHREEPSGLILFFRPLRAKRIEPGGGEGKGADDDKQIENAFKYQLEIERITAEISSTFIHLPLEKIDEGIDYALQLTGKFFEVDSCYLFKVSPDGKRVSNTHKWCKAHIESQREPLQDIPLEAIPWWIEKLKNWETINIPQVGEMPPQAAREKAILKERSIQSVLVVPLVSYNKILGFMGFDYVAEERIWTQEEISRLKVMAEIISSALSRQEAEEETLKAHQRLIKILDTMDASVIVTDLDTHEIIFLNRYGQELWGNVVGKKCWQVFQVDQKESCYSCSKDNLFDGEGKPQGVYQWNYKSSKDGRWYECRETALPWIDERLVKMGMVTDITEYKELEEELHKERNKLSLLLEGILDNSVMWIDLLDVKGNVTFWNKAAEEMSGYKAEEVTGHNKIWEWLYPDPQYREKILKKALDIISRGERVENLETRIRRKDGQYRTILWQSNNLVDNGEVVGSIALGADITQRKMLEQEMFKGDKLESIGLLAGGIAHDFNNYLAILLGNVSLAKHFKENPNKIEEKLKNMEKAVFRARDLSNQLFTFARGADPVKKTTCIKSLIQDNVKFSLTGSNVDCEFYLEEDLYPVDIDEGQITQVINNIVINADQAMPEGGKIQVTGENVKVEKAHNLPVPPGNYVKISCTDEGVGIREKDLPKIFDPFYSTKEKGRGLGLASSYSIIKSHGGHLGVKSQLGVGSTFTLFLPASTRVDLKKSKGYKIIPGRGKILIMDDEKEVAEVTAQMLSTFGYEVFHAPEGRKAIEMYMEAIQRGHPFDLVIMDLTVPGGMGGKQTLQEILKTDPGVKAIVSSGYSDDPVMANFRDHGFKGVLKKPFTLEELSRQVHEVLK
ncbi:MAG: hybrid sensor histidine kinase/response regulator [Candidatus Syntrophonatronum acetioxidans]|uniref:Stage 0 sporulation protein A homolog n=1 Tax=Candidatus Syntrophonatronum acetioxidans TaxID=1795816 RepID=A0A424YER2_9FIRM|nr:MAG: hybrid sensor histidine kinase/response regulator [Candidatus Syntrophonatronum acetioxidans]